MTSFHLEIYISPLIRQRKYAVRKRASGALLTTQPLKVSRWSQSTLCYCEAPTCHARKEIAQETRVYGVFESQVWIYDSSMAQRVTAGSSGHA